MENRKQKENKERMVHVRLPVAIHKKLRIRAAENDKTIQNWLFEVIKRELEHRDAKERDDGV